MYKSMVSNYMAMEGTYWVKEGGGGEVGDIAFLQMLTVLETVTGAMLNQLSYQSHMTEAMSGFGPLCSVDVILDLSL